MVAESLRRLLVVDDDPSIVEGLKYCLMDQYGGGRGEVGRGGSGGCAGQEVYPVVVLDMRMGGISGSDTLKALKQRWRHQQVIVFTGHLTGKSAMEAVNDGAFRYLTKPFRLGNFRRWWKRRLPSLIESSGGCRRVEEPKQLEELGLSEREVEVAFRLLQHDGTADIAKAMRISPRTVEKHIERIFYQFGISLRSQARLAGARIAV